MIYTLCTYRVRENKPTVTILEMLEKTVELSTVHTAPGTQTIIAGLRLLPSVVIIDELIEDTEPFLAFFLHVVQAQRGAVTLRVSIPVHLTLFQRQASGPDSHGLPLPGKGEFQGWTEGE